MQKNDCYSRHAFWRRRKIMKTLLVMKLTFVLLTAAFLNGYAHTEAQSVTLSGKDIPLKRVFNKIKQQTGYVVFTSKEILVNSKPVSLSVSDMPLIKFLDFVLRNQSINYRIEDKTIMLARRLPVRIQSVALTSAESNFILPFPGDITIVVLDSAGRPLEGASIRVKGTQKGVNTDANGHAILKGVATNAKLVISFTGYSDMEVAIGNKTTINIKLTESAKNLDEIVVIGYGTVKKRDLTGSVVSVKGDEITKVPSANVVESLQGKIPGADITRSSGQAGAGINITLRGNRSIVGSNSPLFIVDGVIYYGSIADIDANDVASVDVLKDASSTAIYGSRGANGVIIITTKRGTSGKAQVNANSYYGASQVAMYPKVGSGADAVAIRREAYRTVGKWNSVADDKNIFNTNELYDVTNNLFTNYQDLLLHRGLQEDHQVGVTSGTEKTKVYTSLDYYKENGLFKMDNFNRFSGRLNIDQTIGKIFKAGMQAQITYNNQNVRQDPLNQANKISPYGPAFNADGTMILYPNSGASINPLADEQPGVYANNVKSNRTFAAAYAELTPITGLSIRSNFSVNISNSRNGIYQGSNTISRNGSASRSNYNTSTGTDLLWDNIINYHKEIDKNSFDLTAIGSYQDRTAETGSEQGDGQLLASQIYYGLGGATSGLIASTSYSKQDIVSGAGRINYSYNGRYLLTLTGRSDGSSKLGEGHKWTFFPSAAAAWRIHDESFLKSNKTISDLKLRASYGIAGNDPYSPYVTQSVLTQVPFSYGETAAQGYTFNPTVGNPDLEWERSATLNLGLDFGFFKGRLSGTLDLYNTHTEHLLMPRILPTSTGVSSTVQNIGQTQNKGLELAITSTNIKNINLSWTTSITFTRNIEKISQLVNAGVNDIASGYFVGYPTSVFYDYQKIGIWQTSEAAEATKFGQTPGTIKVRDQNGDSKIDATNDRIVLGTPRPKWSGGINNTIRYKNWDFNIYIYARIGAMINANSLGFANYQGTTGNIWAASRSYWTPENPTNGYPRPNANGGLQYLSTLPYTDGSFGRVRDISLGYTLPKKFTGSVFKSLHLYVNGKNLFTVSKVKDYDPERGGSENYPMTKMVIAGINATF